MVHEAMVLEYSGRHLAMIELAAALKLLLYISLIACIFLPFGIAPDRAGPRLCRRPGRLSGQARRAAAFCSGVFETSIAKMRVFRVPELPRRGADARPARRAAAVRVGGVMLMHTASPSTSPTCSPAGWCWSASCCCTRTGCTALLNVFALHALVLALSVAWQAYIQHAPHLYITAAIALGFKAIMIPVALHRMVFRLGIHRRSRPWSASVRPCWPASAWWPCR